MYTACEQLVLDCTPSTPPSLLETVFQILFLTLYYCSYFLKHSVETWNTKKKCKMGLSFFKTVLSWQDDLAPPLPRPATAQQAAQNALSFCMKLQTEDGHWSADYGGPFFLMPGGYTGPLVLCHVGILLQRTILPWGSVTNNIEKKFVYAC